MSKEEIKYEEADRKRERERARKGKVRRRSNWEPRPAELAGYRKKSGGRNPVRPQQRYQRLLEGDEGALRAGRDCVAYK